MDILKKINFIFSLKQKLHLLLLLGLLFFRGFVELIGIFMVLPIVKICMDSNYVFNSPYLLKIYNYFNFKNEKKFLIAILFGFVMLYILKNLYLAFTVFVKNKIIYSSEEKLADEFMEYYLRQQYSFYLNKRSVEIYKSIMQSIPQFISCVQSLLLLTVEGLTVLFIGGFLFVFSPKISAIASLLLISILLLHFKVFDKILQNLGKDYNGKFRDIIKILKSCYDSIKETKVYKNENYFYDLFAKSMHIQIKSQHKRNLISEIPVYVIETVCTTVILGSLAIIIFVGGDFNLKVLIPQLAILAMAVFRLLPAVNRINNSLDNMLFCKSAVNNVYNEVRDIREFQAKNTVDLVNIEKQNFDITLSDVSYTYPNCEEPVLKDVNLKIPKGTFVGITGKSGAGKSTLADIILGLLKPQEGNVFYNDYNINEKNYNWSNSFAYIHQSVLLLDDTVKNNIKFPYINKEDDEAKLLEVIEKSGLKELIDTFPKGLETVVGERGLRLSGGQRQKILLARILYLNPKVIIMDEATSALDYEAESAVLETICKIKNERTLIVITHRHSTLKDCDLLFEVNNKKVLIKDKSELG